MSCINSLFLSLFAANSNPQSDMGERILISSFHRFLCFAGARGEINRGCRRLRDTRGKEDPHPHTQSSPDLGSLGPNSEQGEEKGKQRNVSSPGKCTQLLWLFFFGQFWRDCAWQPPPRRHVVQGVADLGLQLVYGSVA